MTYKTRKHIWPLALMSLAVFGVLAAVVALSVGQTQVAQAHPCDTGTIQERTQCDTDHENDGLDSTDPNHEHDANQAPAVSAPAMDPVRITGVMVQNADGEKVNNTETVTGVAGYFSDPDDDELTFTVGSSDTSVATGMLDDDGNLVITAQGVGRAIITVTATDPAGATATSTIEVTVRLSPEERYDVSILNDEDVPAEYIVDPDNVATITTTAYPIEVEDVKFEVSALDATGAPLGASDEDVTLTVEVMPNDQAEVLDSLGLDSSGLNIGETLQGLITIRGVDAGRRIFSLDVECLAVGGQIYVDILDDQLNLVAEAMVLCAEPAVIVPDDDKFRSDIMTVVSYNDWDHWDMYATVSDGFLIDDPGNNVVHMVNEDSDNNMMGILVRDEPVMDDYQLAISEKEMLKLMAGEGPDRLTKAEAEAGQHTIEVLVEANNVQLTVTSTMEGPAYVRFLDSDMQPFSTDVDEEPKWIGASVVGLDEGRLTLNPTDEDLTKAEALAYDQYRVIIPGAADDYAYLYGLAGSYHQGTFRFFKPCPEVGHHFYVEVYESEGKYLKTTEKVMCVLSPRPGPTGLSVKIDSQEPGDAMLEYRPARNAVSHDVLLIDESNRNIVTTVEDAESPVMFDNLNSGWTYHYVVLAEGVNGQYTADYVTDTPRWPRHRDVPLSTDASNTGAGHALCSVDDAEITALLSNCDTEPMTPPGLGEPEIVSATVDDSDPGSASVIITWTDGANADGHEVGLVDLSDYSVRDHRVTDGRTSHTFTNVASGRYMAIVVSTMDVEFLYAVDIVVVP